MTDDQAAAFAAEMDARIRAACGRKPAPKPRSAAEVGATDEQLAMARRKGIPDDAASLLRGNGASELAASADKLQATVAAAGGWATPPEPSYGAFDGGARGRAPAGESPSEQLDAAIRAARRGL